ncbi:hypothetical protein D3C74_471560 [compost metagenome]
MLFARASAVRIVGAFTHEGAVHTMLSVEHRQMLMNHDLHARGIAVFEQINHLLNVQVIGRRHCV